MSDSDSRNIRFRQCHIRTERMSLIRTAGMPDSESQNIRLGQPVYHIRTARMILIQTARRSLIRTVKMSDLDSNSQNVTFRQPECYWYGQQECQVRTARIEQCHIWTERMSLIRAAGMSDSEKQTVRFGQPVCQIWTARMSDSDSRLPYFARVIYLT